MSNPTTIPAQTYDAAPDLYHACRKAPDPPAGFREMTSEEQMDWLIEYLDWWTEVRNPALRKANGATR